MLEMYRVLCWSVSWCSQRCQLIEAETGVKLDWCCYYVAAAMWNVLRAPRGYHTLGISVVGAPYIVVGSQGSPGMAEYRRSTLGRRQNAVESRKLWDKCSNVSKIIMPLQYSLSPHGSIKAMYRVTWLPPPKKRDVHITVLVCKLQYRRESYCTSVYVTVPACMLQYWRAYYCTNVYVRVPACM